MGLFGDLGGERGGGGDGNNGVDADAGGFGYHFVAGAAGQQQPALLGVGAVLHEMPDEFV